MNENKEKTAGNLANSVVEGYDYSVAVRMSGRAGAYSPTGGKGNAFEVMYSDKKNLSNLLKPDTTTTLTNSSTARQVDLVTKKGNRIIERIQCKDTPSAKGTMDTIKRVQNGQYRTTQLVGTSESAAAFNAKAPSQGVTKVMKDSGISTKDTTRVSNKFNGVQSSTGIANAAKSGQTMVLVSHDMSFVAQVADKVLFLDKGRIIESGNVASGALKGSVSGAAGTAASEATMAALAAAPIPLAAKVVIGIGAGMFAGSVASDVISDVCDGVGDIVSGIVDGIGDFFGSLFL